MQATASEDPNSIKAAVAASSTNSTRSLKSNLTIKSIRKPVKHSIAVGASPVKLRHSMPNLLDIKPKVDDRGIKIIHPKQTDHVVANYSRPNFDGLKSKIDNRGIEIDRSPSMTSLRLSSSNQKGAASSGPGSLNYGLPDIKSVKHKVDNRGIDLRKVLASSSTTQGGAGGTGGALSPIKAKNVHQGLPYEKRIILPKVDTNLYRYYYSRSFTLLPRDDNDIPADIIDMESQPEVEEFDVACQTDIDQGVQTSFDSHSSTSRPFAENIRPSMQSYGIQATISPAQSPRNSMDDIRVNPEALQPFNPEVGIHETGIQTDIVPEPEADDHQESDSDHDSSTDGSKSPDSGFGGAEDKNHILDQMNWNESKDDKFEDQLEDKSDDDTTKDSDDEKDSKNSSHNSSGFNILGGLFGDSESEHNDKSSDEGSDNEEEEQTEPDPYEDIFENLEPEPSPIEVTEVAQVVHVQPVATAKASVDNTIFDNDKIDLTPDDKIKEVEQINDNDPRPSRRLPQRSTSVKTSFVDTDCCACPCFGSPDDKSKKNSMASLSKMSSASGSRRLNEEPGCCAYICCFPTYGTTRSQKPSVLRTGGVQKISVQEMPGENSGITERQRRISTISYKNTEKVRESNLREMSGTRYGLKGWV